MNRQLLDNVAVQVVGLLRSTGNNYQEFRHNGQSALLMKNSESNEVHLSFGNSHRSTSFFHRLLHPSNPFQFQLNTATNSVRQIGGPQVLSPMEMVAALEGVKFSFQAGTSVPLPYGGIQPPAYGAAPFAAGKPLPPYTP